jgi:hypothetical protein
LILFKAWSGPSLTRRSMAATASGSADWRNTENKGSASLMDETYPKFEVAGSP